MRRACHSTPDPGGLAALPADLVHKVAGGLSEVGDRAALGMVSRQLRQHMASFPWGRRDYPSFVLHEKPSDPAPLAWRRVIAQRRLLDMDALVLGRGFGPHLRLRRAGAPARLADEVRDLERILEGRTSPAPAS